ncbi:hypothetical protein CLIM01_03608 [Colletotrichum limetticola]|uniref:Uncharacterized protein n=1 Tax=Colletotrichum limetticola TaxID=1209924 RepID=A0ABQ9Q5R9_9PEZI|nr:hypothetical protein CLIM01_03608 [Colletotrichum limetticola]
MSALLVLGPYPIYQPGVTATARINSLPATYSFLLVTDFGTMGRHVEGSI